MNKKKTSHFAPTIVFKFFYCTSHRNFADEIAVVQLNRAETIFDSIIISPRFKVLPIQYLQGVTKSERWLNRRQTEYPFHIPNQGYKTLPETSIQITKIFYFSHLTYCYKNCHLTKAPSRPHTLTMLCSFSAHYELSSKEH